MKIFGRGGFSKEDGIAREFPKNPPCIPHNLFLFHLLPKDQSLDFLPKDQPLFFNEKNENQIQHLGSHSSPICLELFRNFFEGI